MICRVLACTLSVTLLCLLFFSFSVSASPILQDGGLEDVLEWTESPFHENIRRSNESPKLDEEYPTSAPSVQEPLQEVETPSVKPEEDNTSLEQLEQETKAETAPVQQTGSEDGDIVKAMHHVTTLFPDELRMQSLVAPFAETGEAHVRDLALRVRVFKEAFEAWESLHFVHHQDSVYQQDIIQKLRKLDLPSAELRTTVQAYDQFRAYVNKLAEHLFPYTSAYFPDHMSLHSTLYNGGRGIVMTAGNDQAKFLLTSIPSFRRLGCQLPIEVLYLGDTDLDEEWRDKLEDMPGVITRDLAPMIKDAGWTLKGIQLLRCRWPPELTRCLTLFLGWAAKPFAMLMSSFREVLFIDADALFFVNPETLFEDDGYLETGALFFADRNLSPQDDKRAWLRKVLPKPVSEKVKRSNRLWTGESVHMQDSGVVLVDTWKHFVSMLLTTRLNGPDRDGNSEMGKRGVYDMVYGDKETFWLSWEMIEDDQYTFHDSVAGNMGLLEVPKAADESSTPDETNNEPNGTLSPPDSKNINSTDHEEHKNEPEPEPEPDSDHKTANLPTVCSPQLLHFDRNGKPLWWNGWIATSKFKEDHGKLAQFDVYVKEPKEVLKPEFRDRWDIRGSNIVCLRSDDVTPLTSEEHDVLDMIMDIARKNTPD